MVVQFDGFIPVYLIDYAAAVSVIIIAMGVIYKARQWVRVLPSSMLRDAKREFKTNGMAKMFLSELGNRVIAQRDVITDSRTRKMTHLMVFWGFIGLAFATIWDTIFFREGVLPVPLSPENFGNIVGNVGGLLVVVGAALIILRYAVSKEYQKRGDLVFLTTLYLATITGFSTEFTRFSFDSLAYGNYIVHLAFVTALLITAPFTHFFHAILTPLMRYVGRLEVALSVKKSTKYPSYRMISMARLAEEVRDGRVAPAYPGWLRKKEKGPVGHKD